MMDNELIGGTVIPAGITDKESARGITIPLGITSSWTQIHRRNNYSTGELPALGCKFTGGIIILCELPAHGQGIHQRNKYSAGNYQLMDANSPEE
jgi:hypothetical protein